MPMIIGIALVINISWTNFQMLPWMYVDHQGDINNHLNNMMEIPPCLLMW